MAARRILVTGARGFLGRRVLARLLERGEAVTAISREERGEEGGVSWVRFDLARDSPEALVASTRPTHLLHLAWLTDPLRYRVDPENLEWLSRSLALVRAFQAGGGERVVVAGSCAELAQEPGLYGVCKDALRRVLDELCRAQGPSFAWARLFFVYGAGEPRGRFVSSMAAALVRGEAFVYRRPNDIRDYVHVEDAARAVAALAASELTGEIEIGGGEGISVGRLARLMQSLVGGGEVVAREDDDGPPHRLVARETERLAALDARPRVALESGLAELVASLRPA